MKIRVEFTVVITDKQAIIDEFRCGPSDADIRDCIRGHCEFASEIEIQCADETASTVGGLRR